MMDVAEDYWFQQRYDDMFFDIHGHFNGQIDPECTLCGNTDEDNK